MSLTPRILLIAILSLFTFALILNRVYAKLVTLEPNSPPVAVNDSYTIHNQLLISPAQNDYEPDPGDYITSFAIATQPQHGTLFYYNNWSRTYRAAYGYVGSDSFTYTITDNHGAQATGTVNLTIVNQPPVAATNSYTVHTSLLIYPAAGSYDPDNDGLNFDSIVTQPQHGTLSYHSFNSRVYTPAYGYVGSDSFTYSIKDTLGATATGTVNITNVNQAPIAVPDFYVKEGASLLMVPTQNDFDPDQGDSLNFQSIVTQPSHGTVSVYSGSTYQYTPTAGYTGFDSFTYRIVDNLGAVSTATVHILVLGQTPTAEKAPYGCCPSDPATNSSFNPDSGALRRLLGGGLGPQAGDPVNLATGREIYTPDSDLVIYNPTGPAVDWRRSYLSTQAISSIKGYASPGLSRGWVHNYDVSIQGVSGSWSAVKLVYPNGGSELLTPVLNAGQPTGSFTTVAGSPYRVEGIPGTPTGTWQSITITWKDNTKWKFTQLSGTTYALNQLTNRTNQSLAFTWNASRALTQITDVGSSSVLLTLAYSSRGKLTTATDIYGRQITYGFSAISSTTDDVLQSVSQVTPAGTPNPPAHFTYGYATDKGLLLNSITVPSPTGTGNSSASINYDSIGRVSSLVDANGNQRVYTYNSGTTQVQVKDSSNNVALSWIQKFNSGGLDTGITDAANHSTTIAYTDSANPLKPTSVTDRNGHATNYTYDYFGNVLTVTTPRNVTTTYTRFYQQLWL